MTNYLANLSTLSLTALTVSVVVGVFCLGLIVALRQRNVHLWLGDYWRGASNRRALKTAGPIIDVMVCVADHYEPRWDTEDPLLEAQRVALWTNELPTALKDRFDSDGKAPQHTFFFPYEEYREDLMNELTALCESGYGEIEIHLHHGHDDTNSLRTQLSDFVHLLHWRHGALGTHSETGEPGYAFVHGNWALNNSGGSDELCGVNDEISVLLETGCFVDMTLPSAPSDTQVNIANRLYYANSSADAPTGHATGEWVRIGGSAPSADHLMLITGPLGFNWRRRKLGVLPRIENGELSDKAGGSGYRAKLWQHLSGAIEGRPEWRFIKLHCHGTQEKDHGIMLGQECTEMYTQLEQEFRDTVGYRLHYVSAREMYNIAKAAEAGETGNPNDYRDYLYRAPRFRVSEPAKDLSAGR